MTEIEPSAAAAESRNGKREFDHLRVDDFLKTLLDARSLSTAFRIGLVDLLLEKGTATGRQLEEQCGAESGGMDLLLNLLAANGAVEDRNGVFTLSGNFLRALQYRDLLELKIDLCHFAACDLLDCFDLLICDPGRFMKEARTYRLFSYERCGEDTEENRLRTERWMRITTILTKYEAQACLARHDFGSFRRLLDIGGNSGEFALQVCRAHPRLTATVLDLPVVCRIGKEHVRRSPEADRIAFVEGNALVDPLPAGHDIVVFKSVLHDWPEPAAAELLSRAYGCLAPGGTLLVFERGPAEIGTAVPAFSAIPFFLFHHSFRSPAFYADHLGGLGATEVRIRRVDLEMPFFLVTARKAFP